MPLNNPILDATLNGIDLDEIKKEMGPPPWARPVVLADHVCGTVIYQNPGQDNDTHCHDYDEWWVVLEGEIDWVVEGREDDPVQAKAGSFVYVPAMTFHHIYPKGDGPSVRLAITLPGTGHMHARPARKATVSVER
ncbi:cupin domain-containing protein [Candidatus Poribacteria bacterium]|jgi:mannose-6-phosphate isomerase-like protein (cupin superfamily)|nr:cupin domain-containing protein [Candidatus Poribacteria bacterium]MBT5531807.1 cupin domain-containing protein [Candidatus Poribacteria bacterium]MBT5715127.1 cupin domain-containing protein [Candidatus Poribacteria bacterium]MBT7097373.1 cupin domain-containing protein [Candidatus Poribacteria bacterium]MBT7807412.1 cupin domain-containing protein [Candidatus Poribacteria bacterium]